MNCHLSVVVGAAAAAAAQVRTGRFVIDVVGGTAVGAWPWKLSDVS